MYEVRDNSSAVSAAKSRFPLQSTPLKLGTCCHAKSARADAVEAAHGFRPHEQREFHSLKKTKAFLPAFGNTPVHTAFECVPGSKV